MLQNCSFTETDHTLGKLFPSAVSRLLHSTNLISPSIDLDPLFSLSCTNLGLNLGLFHLCSTALELIKHRVPQRAPAFRHEQPNCLRPTCHVFLSLLHSRLPALSPPQGIVRNIVPWSCWLTGLVKFKTVEISHRIPTWRVIIAKPLASGS